MSTGKKKITLCIGSSCFVRGNARNVEIAEAFLKERGLKDGVDIELSGALCMGHCADGPIVIVDGTVHRHVDRNVMRDILEELFPSAPEKVPDRNTQEERG